MGGWVPHVSASSFLLLSSPSHPVSSLISVAAVWGVYVPQRALVPLHFSARPFHAMPGLHYSITLFFPVLRSLLCKNWLSDLVGSSAHGLPGPSPSPPPVLVPFHGIELAFSSFWYIPRSMFDVTPVHSQKLAEHGLS